MSERRQQHKDVPDFVEAKYTGNEVEDLGDVHHSAKSIDNTTGDKPAKDPDGERLHFSRRADAQPAHDYIDACVQPARRIDVEHLHEDPDQCQRPDDAQHAPFQEASKAFTQNGVYVPAMRK